PGGRRFGPAAEVAGGAYPGGPGTRQGSAGRGGGHRDGRPGGQGPKGPASAPGANQDRPGPLGAGPVPGPGGERDGAVRPQPAAEQNPRSRDHRGDDPGGG